MALAVVQEGHHVLLPIPPVTSTPDFVGLELAGATPSSDRAQMYSEKTRDLGTGHDCVLARPLLSRRTCHHTLSSCRAGSRFERYPCAPDLLIRWLPVVTQKLPSQPRRYRCIYLHCRPTASNRNHRVTIRASHCGPKYGMTKVPGTRVHRRAKGRRSAYSSFIDVVVVP